ncbi:MAG: site-specific DNA-methyltransferase [Acidobacteria bacterium]|nr:site-specific DNA-methyltransferase [Acidobacteriota bacterium]
MAKIEITRTELVWPGKYNEDGTLKEVPRVSLPFQVIETVNESRATREAKKGDVQGGLFDVYEGKEGDTFEAGWRNKLIWGDNLLVMGSLLEKFAGKIDLIYIDPPFMMGTDFSFDAAVGDSGEEIPRAQSSIEEKVYRDTWGDGISSFAPMIAARLRLIRELLSWSGNLFIHLDATVVHYVKCICDELLGVGGKNDVPGFRSEVIWFHNVIGTGTRVFPKTHETLLWYAKSTEWYLNAKSEHARVPYSDRITETLQKDEKGWYYVRGNRDSSGNVTGKWFRTYVDPEEIEKGKFAADVWDDIKSYRAQGEQATGYATQKPEKLLERVVGGFSKPGDLVADFFCGSGTTLAVAEKLGRRWIGCDLGRWGIHVTRKRLLGIENCKPFEVLNLGRYERQYWQGVTFGEAKDKPLAEQTLYEYLAFILKLYGAQPLAGMAYLHGKKGKAMVHIGAVDAPVTIAEIDAAVDECAKLKQGELHVLGWEWEMGLYDLMVEAAKKKGVKLLLLQIPREVMEQQAAAKGDVRFFELAYLEAEIKQPKKLSAQVVLTDFVIPNTELIPEDVRGKVKKWSDYIDYWAVDWNFRNDTFMQGWVAYRTRKERKLPLTSDPHVYEKPGKYRILVKVIDIFGNDTSQAFDLEVK